MKNLSNLRKLSLFCFICLLSLNLLSQLDPAHTLQIKPVIKIEVDTIITGTTTLEIFESQLPISGLAFSGDIVLHSESSLVRIILMDTNYNEYLLYEAYPILSGSKQFTVSEVGEETTLLDQVIPQRMSIELVDASVYLKEFTISQEDAYQAISKRALMLQQSKNKIDRINLNLQNLGQTWVAGETSISRLSYQEKKSMFGGHVPNFQGFDYYVGGVFVSTGALLEDVCTKGTRSEYRAQEKSQYPGEFSWKDRHGANWLTPVKNQTPCNSCYAFGTNAAAELLVNLYFNRHIDYDLSEQNILSCLGVSCKEEGFAMEALDFILNTGVVLEDCFPYTGPYPDCSELCINPSEQIKINNWKSFSKEEDFKREIITGACAATIFSWRHFVQIIGYNVLEAGDKLYYRGYDSASCITVEQNSPLIGLTAWLCKNSWGESWGNNGFAYFIADIGNVTLYSLNGPVESKVLDESDIRCTDIDGDGYYFWGIGPKPAHCPDCPDIPDGDDSDPCIGPSDEFGNLKSITPSPEGKDSIILLGSTPDLYIHGINIQWYKDEELKNLVHEGELFKTGHTLPGKYTYYASQTIAGCESEAVDVSLSILAEIPPPTGQDTTINIREKALLTVKGEPDAAFKWYEDSLLNNVSGTGESFEVVKADTGIYTYYVTQKLGSFESKPDTVLLTLVNYNSVPDTAFLYALFDRGVDTNSDGVISNEEAEAIIKLDVSAYGIIDMTGIEAFVNLSVLDCSDNTWLRIMDVSNNPALTNLICNNNRLPKLNVLNNPALTHLNCNNNRLYTLNVKNNPALTYLNCSGNYFSFLNVNNNPELTHLDCSNCTWLQDPALSNNPALTYLNCSGNRFSKLDVSNNDVLCELYCSSNMIKNLYLPNNGTLSHVECHFNRISGLDISDETALSYLNCAHNNIANLDVSNNTLIKYLACGDNNLSSLDISNNTALTYLEFANMSRLNQVCIWALPFPPGEVHLETSGSPNVHFTTDCSLGSDLNDYKHNKIKIHPNPTYISLNIETDISSLYSVYIISLSGKLISSFKFEGTNHTIDLSSFQRGAYLITIRSRAFLCTRKIIKL